jgi:hypothetical protein
MPGTITKQVHVSPHHRWAAALLPSAGSRSDYDPLSHHVLVTRLVIVIADHGMIGDIVRSWD